MAPAYQLEEERASHRAQVKDLRHDFGDRERSLKEQHSERLDELRRVTKHNPLPHCATHGVITRCITVNILCASRHLRIRHSAAQTRLRLVQHAITSSMQSKRRP